MINDDLKRMIEKFQCPGCAVDERGDNGCLKMQSDSDGLCCKNHVIGTFIMGTGHIALGLPKGFSLPGFCSSRKTKNKIDIRLWPKGSCFEWDLLNIPIWAFEEDGYIFVRTFAPRVNFGIVDVISDKVNIPQLEPAFKRFKKAKMEGLI
jgi:hypothetical protein